MTKKEISTIGENIKKYRANRGISQDKLSKLANITLKIESGAIQNLAIGTVHKRAKALNISLDKLTKP